MNLLVTGGSGFIGSNFIRQRLFESQVKVDRLVNLDALTYAGNQANLADANKDAKYVFVHGEIGDISLVTKILNDYKISGVINFAAESHVDRSIDSPEPFFQTNVLGALRLLDCVKRYWSSLELKRKSGFRFVQVSTDEVYGTLEPTSAPWDEDCPYQPNSPYAASKASSDHIVRAFNHTYGLPTITTNCSNNYGPYQFPEKLIPLMILNALEAKPMPVYGDGKQIRDWLYVDDHCDAIWLALTRGEIGSSYNVGGFNEHTNIDIIKCVCRILDDVFPRGDAKSYSDLITYVADRPGHDRRYAIDSTKIRRDLGWSPVECFETGIEKTINWYLMNRQWAANITKKQYVRGVSETI